MITLLALALFGGGFYIGYDMRDDQAKRLEQVEQRAIAASQQGAAIEIAKIEVKNTTITQQVIERIKTEKVYADCVHSPDTWKLIQEAYK